MMAEGHPKSPEGVRKFLRTLPPLRQAPRNEVRACEAPNSYPGGRRTTRGVGCRRARLDPPWARATRLPDPLTRAGRGDAGGPATAGVAEAPGKACPRRRA